MQPFHRCLGLFVLIFMVINVFLCTRPLTVEGAPITDPGALKQMIQKTRQEISNQKKREKSVLNNLLTQQQKLSQLEDNYQQIQHALGVAENKVNATRQELFKLQSNFEILESNLQEQRDLLNRRLVAIYKSGPQTYWDLIFISSNFADFVAKFDMLSFFIRDNLRRIDHIKQTQIIVRQQTVVIQNKKAQVESEYNQTLGLQNKLAKEQQKVTAQVGTTKRELNNIQSNRRKLEKALQEFEETSRQIEAELRRKQNSNPVALGNGRFIWPVRGPISSPFGWRLHPILKKKIFHSGIDIAVPFGASVRAADAGVVAVSGWQGGYGNFIAIDHGNGLATCYGHNSRLLVKEGDKVSQGQVIALAGSTGLATGPHVHFEVRRNGTTVNPMSFLP